jgi:ABC-type multidrug transport system ATPase subunit
MEALKVENLVKTYATGTQALKGASISIAEGDFFALLGPNGAGKTTLIGISTGLVNKTSGTVSVFGHDIDDVGGVNIDILYAIFFHGCFELFSVFVGNGFCGKGLW